MQSFHAARRADRINATYLAAATGIARNGDGRIARKRGGYRAMAPFASKAASALMNFAIDNNATTDTGAKDDTEYNAVTASGANNGFG